MLGGAVPCERALCATRRRAMGAGCLVVKAATMRGPKQGRGCEKFLEGARWLKDLPRAGTGGETVEFTAREGERGMADVERFHKGSCHECFET